MQQRKETLPMNYNYNLKNNQTKTTFSSRVFWESVWRKISNETLQHFERTNMPFVPCPVGDDKFLFVKSYNKNSWTLLKLNNNVTN